MTPITISESDIEPITLDEAAANLHVIDDGNSPPTYYEGARILRLIKAARQACEQELEISLVEKTLEIAQDSFSLGIALPCGPVRSIVSVTYVDAGGAEVELASDQYRFSGHARSATVVPAYGLIWPAARNDVDSVRVRYTVGYSADNSPPDEVPEPIRQAMHLFVAHYFAHREAVDLATLAELPLGARYLLSPYRCAMGV